MKTKLLITWIYLHGDYLRKCFFFKVNTRFYVSFIVWNLKGLNSQVIKESFEKH